jgi:hypothetical protein
VRYVKRGQRVELKTQAYPGRTIRGVIAEDPIMFFAGELPKAFSSQRLGDVPTYIDAHGRELPVSRTFEAVVEVEKPEGLIRPGMTARGKIFAGKRPWGQLVLQSMLDLISPRLSFLSNALPPPRRARAFSFRRHGLARCRLHEKRQRPSVR